MGGDCVCALLAVSEVRAERGESAGGAIKATKQGAFGERQPC